MRAIDSPAEGWCVCVLRQAFLHHVWMQAMGDDARAVKMPRVDAGAASSSGTAAAASAGTPRETAGAGASTAAAAAAGGGGDAMQADAAGDVDGGAAAADEGASSSSSDDEMAAEVLRTVAGKGKEDPLAAYDINVEEDGEAIQTYLSMLESSS